MVRTTRFLPLILILILTAALSANFANAQTVSFKNFTSFQDIVPGVDFFASSRQAVAPYEEASAAAIARLKTLLGEDLPKGAIFICSNMAQRDSFYEPVVLRQGYSWVLITNAPDMRASEQMERLRSQIGENIPEEMRQRMESMMSNAAGDVDPQAVITMSRNIAFAILQVMSNSNDANFQFRASRADDVGRSTMQDWLDVAIGAYASGDRSTVRYLQENFDMAFPTEDVLFMARPFIASAVMGQSGGGGRAPGGFGGINMEEMMRMAAEFLGEGGFPGGGMPKMGGGGQQGGEPKTKSKPGGGGGGGQPQQLSKDEQDRRLFDGQAITFFDYLLEKVGIEKIRDLINFALDGNESWDYVVRADMVGRDFSKFETDLNEWIMRQSIPDTSPKPKSADGNAKAKAKM